MSRGRRARPVPLWWGEIRDGFLRSLRRRNRRPNTVNSYRKELGAFGAWMAEERGVTSLVGLQTADIEAWQDNMIERQLAPRSQVVRISALRGCLKWAALQEMPLSSPSLWLRIESPRLPPLDPRPIPRRDLELIVRTFEVPTTDIWMLRTRALFWVLFSSGARITEGLSLRRGETERDGTHVTQKGGRPHVLLLSEHAIAAVEDYERARQDDCPMMFASLLPGHLGQPLKSFEVQKGWDRLCRELRLPRFKSHQIRHSCATTMRRNRIDVVLIGKHLGWRGLAMMQNYALVEVEDRQGAVAVLDSLFDFPDRERAPEILQGAIAS